MKLGIFARTFSRPTLSGVLDAVLEHDFTVIQFNMACAGLPSMPDQVPLTLAEQIGRETRKRNLEMIAVSGTFNMIHPDLETRSEGLRRLETLASRAHAMGTHSITLCTGTRDAHDMWHGHPDNDTASAWQDLLASMERALEMAERFDVTLGIEPEIHNVVSTPGKALALHAHFNSKRIQFILDPANLYRMGELPDSTGTLEHAVDALAGNLLMAHAKDMTSSGEYVAPGRGAVNFPRYLERLQAHHVHVPLVTHGLLEHEAPTVRAYLHDLLERTNQTHGMEGGSPT